MKATLQRLEFKRVGQGGYTEVRAMRWVDYNDLASDILAQKRGEREGYGGPRDVTSLSLSPG